MTESPLALLSQVTAPSSLEVGVSPDLSLLLALTETGWAVQAPLLGVATSLPSLDSAPVSLAATEPEALTILPPTGYFAYEQLIEYQTGADIAAPADEIGGLPLAKLFDEVAYLRSQPDVAAAIARDEFSSGYEHFLKYGLFEGRDPSVLYSEAYYLATNEDVGQAIAAGTFASGLEHFLKFGHTENRDPTFRFKQQDYLTQNPDVAAAVDDGRLQSAFEHFIKFGAYEENRLPRIVYYFPAITLDGSISIDSFSVYNPGSLFNEGFYLRANPDVAAAVRDGKFANGLQHFSQYGQYELRDPTVEFDHERYVSSNSDVQAAIAQGLFASGFDHYLLFGRFEYRVIPVEPVPNQSQAT